jgi:pyruvate/2-oxoglutarate dehydrogenase complex dihydrolipoamide acyltransferase (E2) component
MAYKIVMPQLGLTMEEGSVTNWLKNPGDFVEKGETLFTVETDKVEMEVESMGKGYLGKIQVKIGQKVRVGTLLAMLNDTPETDA